MPTRAETALARVRKLCLSLPDASERLNHGGPTFFIGSKQAFVMYLDDHHGDGRLALWCAAPPDAQAMLVESDHEVYFVPPYVGRSGWIGVRLDRGAPWPTIAGAIERAYEARLAKKPARRRRVSPT